MPSVKEGRQSVPDVASEEVESVHSITIEELKQNLSMASMMLATAFIRLSCNVHEDCDGTCSDGPLSPSIRLIEGLEMDLFSKIVRVSSPHPSRAIAQDVPRDFHWLEKQDLPKFEYSAINSLAGEIRLLRVKKGLFRLDIIECDPITIPLDGDQEFQALSYRWGSGTMSDVILCNGKTLHISPSLNAALKTFRGSAKLDVQDQLLWSDTVSIDQSNLIEVSEQIPLMRRIYTEATGVFVHLGLPESQISRGLDLMLRLASIQNHLKHPKECGAISIDDVTLPSEQHPCWTEYFTLFTSPWISRTWILQDCIG